MRYFCGSRGLQRTLLFDGQPQSGFFGIADADKFKSVLQSIAVAQACPQGHRAFIPAQFNIDRHNFLLVSELAFHDGSHAALADVLRDAANHSHFCWLPKLHLHWQLDMKAWEPAYIGKITVGNGEMRPGKIPIVGYMAGHPEDLVGDPAFTGTACGQLLASHDHRFMRRTVLGAVPHQINTGDRSQIAWPETLLRSAGLHTTSISSSAKKPGTSARYC